jgi:crossover junction endodeoxyribonuclease RuvC
MKVLGIDPALNQCGVAIIDVVSKSKIRYVESLTITNSGTMPFHEKLITLHNAVFSVIERHNIAYAALEEPFLNVNAVSSLKLGAARGAILTAILRHGIKPEEYLPNKVKKAITGAGKADKTQVAFMIKRLVEGCPEDLPDDETDAMAIAMTHAFLCKLA